MEFLKAKRISQTEFTRELGVSATYIGAMRKGIPAERLRRICELYPDLNRDWLLYGEGEMLLAAPAESGKPRSKGYETLLLPVEAFAGGLQMYSQGVREWECTRIVTPIEGADFAIPVRGDSMEPRFHEGSTLLLKRINDRAFIPWGHPMVIDTENGVLLKNVLPDPKPDPDDSEEYVVMQSLNPKYPEFKIPASSIYGMYRIMGSFDVFPMM